MSNKTYNLEPNFDPQSRFDNLHKLEPEFWKKPLKTLSKEEWELLCDGCGKCCLNKLEIKGKIKFTNTVCRFLDTHSCICKIYKNRFEKVYDCRDITLESVKEVPSFLPKTCAYRLLNEGKSLPDWHPLITKNANSIHMAKMSLQNRKTVSETGIKNYEDHIIDWEDL